MPTNFTNARSVSPTSDDATPAPKRKSNAAGNTTANGRAVKRRASKACQCCRARKVRCNVVEHGAPCTNCRLDEVECIVTESKRRKKHIFPGKQLDSINEHMHSHHHVRSVSGAEAILNGNVNPLDINNPAFRRESYSSNSGNDADEDLIINPHVPHSLYATQGQRLSVAGNGRSSFMPGNQPPMFDGVMSSASFNGDLVSTRLQTPPAPGPSGTTRGPVPPYIKALPPRMTPEDIHYLWKKGALTIPDTSFRNALLLAYVEFVHPYMPLIELHDFLNIIDKGDGSNGKVSLVLFQAVMFTGTAFVDKSHLEAAGYMTRKAARKAFYLKARLLYDFDYEIDRVALVQSLLLMTYWYETPDDQKDTWHWMGVAISLAHTIGLHRNPEKSNMDVKKQRLWKRIWWSCFMRDRLVALGMRRPTRIKDEDYDVPMLTIDDFEIETLSPDNITISPDCVLIRDLQIQRDLAMLCIAKAKLSLIVSHVLGAQYSVLVKDQGMAQGQEGNTRSSVMLFPKKHDQTEEVKQCDAELSEWVDSISQQYGYKTPTMEEVNNGASSLIVQRALLHMVYFATVSALHRPQVLPSSETSTLQKCRDLQDMSRRKVREASKEITKMSLDLHKLGLERYLPTTGVTVLLPAIIIHLLDIKSHSDTTREAALKGFFACMQVLTSLRDNYAAADYATQFLEAAIKKADIDVGRYGDLARAGFEGLQLNAPRKGVPQIASTPHTPPPDTGNLTGSGNGGFAVPIAKAQPEVFSHQPMEASTPPESESHSSLEPSHPHNHGQVKLHNDTIGLPTMSSLTPGHFDASFEQHFDELINYNDGTEAYGVDNHFEGGWTSMVEDGIHGESGGFMMDVDWIKDAEHVNMWSPEGLEADQTQLGMNGMGKEEVAVYSLLRGAA